MKNTKRLISIALALVTALSMTVTAFAESPISVEDGIRPLSFSYNLGDSFDATKVNKSITISSQDPLDDTWNNYVVQNYVEINNDTVFTVKHTGTSDDGSYISVEIVPYEFNGTDAYETHEFVSCFLAEDGKFYSGYTSADEGGGMVALHAGESKQFTLPASWSTDDVNTLYYLKVNIYYPQYDYSFWQYIYCMSKGDTEISVKDNYVDAIPELGGKVVFSNSNCGTYYVQRTIYDYSIPTTEIAEQTQTIKIYEFPIGTQMKLTDDAIAEGYSLHNISDGILGATKLSIDEASIVDKEYLVNSEVNPDGTLFYIRGVNLENTFSDVVSGSYYVDPVKWAVRYGITSGTTATTFSPNATCTTAQIITFIWRANGSPEPILGNPFTDVSGANYYYKAALWASEYGLVSGTKFNGDTPCTRGETVTYLWKLAGQPDVGESTFSDAGNYSKAVAWALQEGITAGTSATTFSPDATCTRAQIMTFLYRGLA